MKVYRIEFSVNRVSFTVEIKARSLHEAERIAWQSFNIVKTRLIK